jgi:hypothetical protein
MFRSAHLIPRHEALAAETDPEAAAEAVIDLIADGLSSGAYISSHSRELAKTALLRLFQLAKES